ncbi:hypothetical protein BDF20DRAFT_145199 [Mycotypha africana]|uniref:uncharacterized protein n=1 Tax=Mycotypha africana TaxID=64632 RepID=UPI00230002BD|nr:uncharacterized protein BDF20DRAFT_145199 [Mycotypha africana]KAI8969110.1 hypothetical protein BDF20DRAFT_145199 [Mycotypha africana]
MSRARKESALHLTILVLLQWTSMSVVILNAIALYLLKHQSRQPTEQQQQAFVHGKMSLSDYALLILGSVSFVGSTVYFCLYLYLYIQMRKTKQSLCPPKWISATQVILSVISIALWTVACSVILTHSQESSSPCRFPNSLQPYNTNIICKVFDTGLILAFAVVGCWLLALFATLLNLIRSPIPPTTIFTIEAPPSRFSQGTLLSNSNLYNRSSLSTIVASDNNSNIMKPINSYTLQSSHAHSKNKIIPEDKYDDSRKYIIHEELEEEEDYEEQILGLKLTHDSNHLLNTYVPRHSNYYQPQCIPLSPTPSDSISYMSAQSTSSLIMKIPLNDTEQSLSTMESLTSLRDFKPIQFDLPIIKLGMLSHIGVSFLDNRIDDKKNSDQNKY